VLEECGPNIDAAIKKLGQLRLAQEQSQPAAASQPSGACRAGPRGALRRCLPAAAALAASPPPPSAARPALTGPRPLPLPAAAPEPAAAAAAGASAAAPAPAAQPAGEPAAGAPQSGEQWVETIVQEMAAARDMGDARSRASSVLQAFEQFVSGRVRAGGGGGGGGSESKLEEALRENHILKRAVQIQNARMQEALQAKEKEVATLQQALAQHREKLHAAELSNYSLALHLQQATNSTSLGHGRRPPDVF
jgi:hypothetical protein